MDPGDQKKWHNPPSLGFSPSPEAVVKQTSCSMCIFSKVDVTNSKGLEKEIIGSYVSLVFMLKACSYSSLKLWLLLAYVCEY